MSSDQTDSDKSLDWYLRSFLFQGVLRGLVSVTVWLMSKLCVLWAEIFVTPDSGQPEESKVSVMLETVREQLL